MKHVIEPGIHPCRLSGSKVAQKPVHALQGRLDVAVTVAESDAQAFFGVGVAEGEMRIALCGLGCGRREPQRQRGKAFEQQAAMRYDLIPDGIRHG